MYGKIHNDIIYNGIISLEAPSSIGNLVENLSNGKLKLNSSNEILVSASKTDTNSKIEVEYKLNNSKNYVRYTDIGNDQNEDDEIFAKVLNIDEKPYYLLGKSLYDDLQNCIDNQKNFITQPMLEEYNYVTNAELDSKKYLTDEKAHTLISASVQMATNSLSTRLANTESLYVSLSTRIDTLETKIKTLEGKIE